MADAPPVWDRTAMVIAVNAGWTLCWQSPWNDPRAVVFWLKTAANLGRVLAFVGLRDSVPLGVAIGAA